MNSILGFVLAMSVTIALIPPLMHAAARWHILDIPDHRKVHALPVPRVGGIAMAAGMLVALLLVGNYQQPMPAYVVAVLVLLAFGVWDDRVTLGAGAKFSGQIIAIAIVMVWGEVEISSITLTERYMLPTWIGTPLTFFFLLGVTNAVNLADGLDGLAGGTTLLCLAALALLALTSEAPFVGGVAVVIIGAILGFLRFNTHPARVFMGDGGSQILGFSAAVLATLLTQDAATALSAALPLLLLAIPIIDTLMVMTQRLAEGRSPFAADRNHIHHRLLSLGFDHHEAVIVIYGLQGSLFVTAWFMRYESDLTIVVVFAMIAAAVIGSLQTARRVAWRWRHPQAAGVSPSAVGHAVLWLRAPSRLPQWSLITIALTVTVYFICIAAVCPAPTADVRLMALVLAGGVGGSLLFRWRAISAGAIDKAALYVAVVIAVYFDRQAQTLLEAQPPAQWLLFAVLITAIALRFRFAADRRFQITPLDVLVIFAAIVIPNLPGSIAASSTLGESVAKLIALMYGMETLLGAAARWWRFPCVAALTFLVACALRGAI